MISSRLVSRYVGLCSIVFFTIASSLAYASDCTYAGGGTLGSGSSNTTAGLLTGYSNCSGPINVTCQNGTFYDITNSQTRSNSEVYFSVGSCVANTQNSCIYANGTILNHLSTNLNAALSTSTCGTQAVYCDNGHFLDEPGHTTRFTSSTVYPSVASCLNPSGQSCGTASSGVASLYPSGLYNNQWNNLYQASGTVPFFCSTGSLQGGFSVAGGLVSRGCSLPLGSLSCSNTIRNNQPLACGVSANIGLTQVNLGSGSLCIPGVGHSDSSLISSIVVSSVAGGGILPWSRTCDGLYHSGTTCTAQSQGLCGSDGSGGNQSFLSLLPTSPYLCANGPSSGFTIQPITASSLYTARYNWNCMGSSAGYHQACTAYQTPTPAPGICNAGINGQSLVYGQIQNALLCTQGVPSVTLISPVPNSGSQWTRSCLGLGGATSVNCSVNAITNGACVAYPSGQASQPTNLCTSGLPTAVSIVNQSYTWLCNGTNGGISSPLCSAPCANGQCTTSTAGTGSGTSTGTTTQVTTGSNGIPTPISINQLCSDTDGCICYNVTIVNGSRCLSNTLTGTTDSILSPISLGESCLDVDGCICNGLNSIVNGSICQTDGLTGMLPGSADLIISQALTSGAITRRGTVEITISYFNRGPDTATGTKVEYYISPLISKFRTSAPYTLTQVANSGYIESSEYQNNVLVFPIGELKSNEDGKIKIELTLNAGLDDKEIVNSTSLASRVRDPKPLDNAQKLSLSFETQKATTLGITLINPFLGIQKIVNQYDVMNKWLRIDPVFDDIQRGDDDYMPVMTVVRNGIFEGYRYKFSRSFGGEKCTSRIEAINVIAKMMYTAGSTDVYTTRQKGTAYVDTNSISLPSQNFVNRAHERGLLKLLKPKVIRGSLYLEPHKEITQGQIKQIIYAIYQRYGLDPSVVESLLTEEASCTTRGELAYVMTQILRGNPNILMGYNDEFLKQVTTKTSNLTIAQRRVEIQKIIDKLKITEPSVLSANGYDAESLVGILEAAMAGREYNPIVDLTSASNFLYQQRQ